GSVLSRVSRLTEIPADDLHRRFRMPKIRAQRELSAEVSSDESRRSHQGTSAQDLAERWVLGILLSQPARWHDVQQTLRPQEFTDESRRMVAEIYWAYQRDEGEPVFNEFLDH